MNIFEAYKAFKVEGELFGHSNNFFIFLKDYFINRLYDEK
jgi:hypothetical protein